MKVLQVASSLFDWGGIERYVAYLSEGLAARGHEVEVACPPGSPLDKRVAVPRLPLTMRQQFNFPKMVPYLRLFRQKRYDVIHVHFSPDFVLPAMAAKLSKQPKLIMTRHVALKWSPSKVKRYTGLFDHIIPVSHAVEKRLLESGVPASMMTVAKAGCPALQPTGAAKTTPGFTVGFFGRLVPEKGVATLINAAPLLGGDVRIEIYGEGPIRGELEKLAERLGTGDRVVFKGFVPDVADAMASVSAVAVPSVWEEAFPYSVLEAMSVGKPIIASNIGGLPEIVEPGRTGLLVNKEDPQSLAEGIAQLAREASEAEAMGVAGRELHRSVYTVEKMAERIEAVYASL